MLQRISVKNLGCFDDKWHTVEFTQETLLAGPNNSGKSMIIAGMNLLRFLALGHGETWNTEHYRLNSFSDAVNDHDASKTIYVSVAVGEKKDYHTLEAQFRYPKHPILLVDAKAISESSRRVVEPYLRKIWCLSPQRSVIPYQSQVTRSSGQLQPLKTDGSNVINYLLERWTDRDKNWGVAESWFKKIDPSMSEMKTPIRGQQVSFETKSNNMDVNVSLQGSGFQSAAAIISAVVFSPERSTIIVEEPEVFLHPGSQEAIVDMLNDAVNNHEKQLIFSTHSCNVLLPYWNDVGQDAAKRGKSHEFADPAKFSLWTFERDSGKVSINPYPLHQKTFKQFSKDFKLKWG